MSIQPISTTSSRSAERSSDTAPLQPQARSSATVIRSTAAVDPGAAIDKSGAVPSQHELKSAVENINKSMREQSQAIEFSIDQDSERTIVKIVDQNTKEVIRQMPTEEALAISKALDTAQGLLIRQTA